MSLEPAAPSTIANGIWPPVLDEIVLYALRKNPDQRFQSAAAFAKVLRRFVEAVHAPLPPAENDGTEAGEERLSVPAQATKAEPPRPNVLGSSKIATSNAGTQRPQRRPSRATLPRHISLQQLLLFVAVSGLTTMVVSRLAHAILVRL